jgi:hypothetical protein
MFSCNNNDENLPLEIYLCKRSDRKHERNFLLEIKINIIYLAMIVTLCEARGLQSCVCGAGKNL